MAALLSSSLCVLPARNEATTNTHSLARPPHHLSLHFSRSFQARAAAESSNQSQPSPADLHHHHHHHKPLRSPPSPSPFFTVVPPLAASLLLISVCCPPAEAGIFSGSSGLTSFELPSLPTPDILKKIQEENKTRYESLDEKFKSSSLLQELLKRSKQNAELHKQEIQDKYCQRGADWGVGDCSTAAMSEEERTTFMETLKGKQSAE